MKRLALAIAIVIALIVVSPVAAAPRQPVRHAPAVAEVNWFYYDQCQNTFWWQTSTEVNIWAFRIEHPNSGWTGEVLNSANYGGISGMTYAILAPLDRDRAPEYWLRVYFDNGTSRLEDEAVRVFPFSKTRHGLYLDVVKNTFAGVQLHGEAQIWHLCL